MQLSRAYFAPEYNYFILTHTRPTQIYSSNTPQQTLIESDVRYAQNLLHTFLRNYPVDGEVANLLATSRCNGNDTTQQT